MLSISNDACYSHAKNLESYYKTNNTPLLLVEANKAKNYLKSLDINKYTNLVNLKLVIYSYIILPLVYVGNISKEFIIELTKINSKDSLKQLLYTII